MGINPPLKSYPPKTPCPSSWQGRQRIRIAVAVWR
nr:MAG TPA: hypothetical protein [Bacteriophage sp.]